MTNLISSADLREIADTSRALNGYRADIKQILAITMPALKMVAHRAGLRDRLGARMHDIMPLTMVPNLKGVDGELYLQLSESAEKEQFEYILWAVGGGNSQHIWTETQGCRDYDKMYILPIWDALPDFLTAADELAQNCGESLFVDFIRRSLRFYQFSAQSLKCSS